MSDKCSLEYYFGLREELFVQANKEKYTGHLDEQEPIRPDPTPIMEEEEEEEEEKPKKKRKASKKKEEDKTQRKLHGE